MGMMASLLRQCSLGPNEDTDKHNTAVCDVCNTILPSSRFIVPYTNTFVAQPMLTNSLVTA